MAEILGRRNYSAHNEKGRRKKVDEYRVTLMPTLYKVYVVLMKKLREGTEDKGIIPQNQTGFRKGMGTMDNIYTLNFLINRQIERKRGKMVVFFVDLKAAFDSVNREILMEAIKERRIREGLTKKRGRLLGCTQVA